MSRGNIEQQINDRYEELCFMAAEELASLAFRSLAELDVKGSTESIQRAQLAAQLAVFKAVSEKA